jgi:glutathione S-transferase
MVILRTSPASPFGRKIKMALSVTGLSPKVELVVANTVDAKDSLRSQNPLGKIPVLVRDDGMALYDSRVICRYLDDLAGARLYGTGDNLWQTLTLEATADGILDAALLMVYEERVRPEDRRFPDWVEGQWAKVARTLDMLEHRHMKGMDMGQLALACALAYLDFRHDARNWRQGRPRLATWEAGMAARSSMQATQPPL